MQFFVIKDWEKFGLFQPFPTVMCSKGSYKLTAPSYRYMRQDAHRLNRLTLFGTMPVNLNFSNRSDSDSKKKKKKKMAKTFEQGILHCQNNSKK